MSQSAEAIKATKESIRQSIRQFRQQISPQKSAQAAHRITEHLTSIDRYKNSHHIASFLSFDGEVDTHQLNQQLIKDKSQCFLPKLKPYPPNRLWFMPYNNQSKTEKNRFGIPEVDLPIQFAIRPSQLNIILLPLVAFDDSGNRLGMGGGFYDASLAHLSDVKQRPLCLGLAYEGQKVDVIPSDSWDFKIDGVITEKRVYWF